MTFDGSCSCSLLTQSAMNNPHPKFMAAQIDGPKYLDEGGWGVSIALV